ncbi:hypothetical protein ARMGADRAFT_529085 [Armillaria gallica]|uniref:Uncharacterized protein n=1 Tax=Armillaria gallica TaxID=47427 RepID=A0A2H3E1Q4_ARMGA|nr:hypothetical protein ARMGADRAFT_529085 [Armillaria gallica]
MAYIRRTFQHCADWKGKSRFHDLHAHSGFYVSTHPPGQGLVISISFWKHPAEEFLTGRSVPVPAEPMSNTKLNQLLRESKINI